jgi:hypothetical protein
MLWMCYNSQQRNKRAFSTQTCAAQNIQSSVNGKRRKRSLIMTATPPVPAGGIPARGREACIVPAFGEQRRSNFWKVAAFIMAVAVVVLFLVVFSTGHKDHKGHKGDESQHVAVMVQPQQQAPAPVQTTVVSPPVVQVQPVENPQAQMYAQPSAMGEGKTFHGGGNPHVDKAGIHVQVIEDLVTEFGTQTIPVVVDANGRPIVCKPNQPAPNFAAGLQPGDSLAVCKIDTAPPGKPATFTPVWVVVPPPARQ